VHRGALEDLASLKRGAAAADGVIHTAFIHDFSAMAASGKIDNVAIETLGAVLAQSGRPLVISSGIGLLKLNRTGTEEDAADGSSAGSHRVASDSPVEPTSLSNAAKARCTIFAHSPVDYRNIRAHGRL
jgi:hypothetical protein